MKKLITIAALLISIQCVSQQRWTSVFGQPFQNPVGISGKQPLNGKEWFCDTTRNSTKYLNTWRPFISYNEALNWLTTAQKFMGTYAFIDSTGSLFNGVVTGGTLLRYVYDANLNLVYDGTVGVPGGGMSSFIQAGTGAVTRTQQDKSRELFSVKDFGALGDGVTNDSAAINRAKAAAGANGYIIFPKGVYYTTSQINATAPGQKFISQGATIKLAGNQQIGFYVNYDSVTIDGFTIQGTGISSDSLIKGTGIFLSGASRCRITNNIINNPSACGIAVNFGINGSTGVLQGSSNNYVAYNTVSNFSNATQDISGILIGYGGDTYENNNIIELNSIDGVYKASHGILFLTNGKKNRFINNTITRTLRYGIALYRPVTTTGFEPVSGNEVSGNVISDVGKPTVGDDFGNGIYLQSTVRTIVSRNVLTNTNINSVENFLPNGAIALNGGSSIVISDNQIDSARYVGININGANNVTASKNNIKKSVIGILVKNADSTNIEGNAVYASNTGIVGTVVSGGKRVSSVENNFVTAPIPINYAPDSSYYFTGSSISGNHLFSSGTYALRTSGVEKSRIVGNIITVTNPYPYSGVLAVDAASKRNSINNNIIEFKTGVGQYGVFVAADSNDVKNNIVINATNYAIIGSVTKVRTVEHDMNALSNFDQSLKLEKENVGLGIGGFGNSLVGIVKLNGQAPQITSSLGNPIIFSQSNKGNVLALDSTTTLTESGRFAANGNFAIGNTLGRYPIDVQYGGGTPQLNFRNGAGDGGGFLGAFAADGSYWGSGAISNGNNWVAKGANPSLFVLNTGQVEFYTDYSKTVGATYVPSKRMVISNMGYVGIGSTAPTATLDLTGSLRFRGNGAANGKVLTGTDSLGNATWQDNIPTNFNGRFIGRISTDDPSSANTNDSTYMARRYIDSVSRLSSRLPTQPNDSTARFTDGNGNFVDLPLGGSGGGGSSFVSYTAVPEPPDPTSPGCVTWFGIEAGEYHLRVKINVGGVIRKAIIY